MIPLTMMPVGANGESAPAWAPMPTMRAMRNGGIRARVATAMAIGASMAAVAMLPGPSDAIPRPSRKKLTGIRPVLPRHRRTERCAT